MDITPADIDFSLEIDHLLEFIEITDRMLLDSTSASSISMPNDDSMFYIDFRSKTNLGESTIVDIDDKISFKLNQTSQIKKYWRIG